MVHAALVFTRARPLAHHHWRPADLTMQSRCVCACVQQDLGSKAASTSGSGEWLKADYDIISPLSLTDGLWGSPYFHYSSSTYTNFSSLSGGNMLWPKLPQRRSGLTTRHKETSQNKTYTYCKSQQHRTSTPYRFIEMQSVFIFCEFKSSQVYFVQLL